MTALGSLFTGYGGLDLAVDAVFDAQTIWHAEIDPAASRVLAHRFPDVPNLGDITKIDWDQVEPVDILGGGFPCQDVSLAGKRAGLRPDSRSGLWSHFALGISKLRPRYVVIENVRGLLSAEAHSDMEPCPWCLGDGPGEPALRALGAVLGDLAALGYDAQWRGLRAADVGAPHGRYRIFILAQDASSIGSGPSWAHGGEPQRADGPSGAGERALGDATDSGRHDARPAIGRTESTWPTGGPGLTAADANVTGPPGSESTAGLELPTRGAAADPASTGLDGSARQDAEQDGRGERQSGTHLDGRHAVDWGQYGPAIERWERTLGRVAPAPTEPNSKGSQRLNPALVEWMMGLPAGWVTDVPSISRNEQLRMLGNGVVPQQAAAALHVLLPEATNTNSAGGA